MWPTPKGLQRGRPSHSDRRLHESRYVRSFSPQQVGVPTALRVNAAGLGGCLLWAYWPTLVALENRWANDPKSSYGFIVPLFAAIVLWTRRPSFPQVSAAIEPWVSLSSLPVHWCAWAASTSISSGSMASRCYCP